MRAWKICTQLTINSWSVAMFKIIIKDTKEIELLIKLDNICHTEAWIFVQLRRQSRSCQCHFILKLSKVAAHSSSRTRVFWLLGATFDLDVTIEIYKISDVPQFGDKQNFKARRELFSRNEMLIGLDFSRNEISSIYHDCWCFWN